MPSEVFHLVFKLLVCVVHNLNPNVEQVFEMDIPENFLVWLNRSIGPLQELLDFEMKLSTLGLYSETNHRTVVTLSACPNLFFK